MKHMVKQVALLQNVSKCHKTKICSVDIKLMDSRACVKKILVLSPITNFAEIYIFYDLSHKNA